MTRELLRSVVLEGPEGRRYLLDTWDTEREDAQRKTILGYRFTGPEGVLFEAEDFHASPLYPIDGDETVRALLGFLTLKPGDTDREYFEKYTPSQMAFAEGDAEYLASYSYREEAGGLPLVDC